MALTRDRNERSQYQLYLGVMFAMRDGSRRVVCRVTKAALDDRSARSGRLMTATEAFDRYRSNIEAVASAQYERGVESPVVDSEDLVPIRIRSSRGRRAALQPPPLGTARLHDIN
jgi:hypothetical protein